MPSRASILEPLTALTMRVVHGVSLFFNARIPLMDASSISCPHTHHHHLLSFPLKYTGAMSGFCFPTWPKHAQAPLLVFTTKPSMAVCQSYQLLAFLSNPCESEQILTNAFPLKASVSVTLTTAVLNDPNLWSVLRVIECASSSKGPSGAASQVASGSAGTHRYILQWSRRHSSHLRRGAAFAHAG